MYFSESQKQAEKYCEMALKAMREHRVIPHPANFAVWFVYHNGRHPDLKKEIDALIDEHQDFTDERSAEIYDRFFSNESESEALEESSRRLESVVSQLLGYLGESEGNAENYGEALVSYSGQLSETSSPDQVREVVGSLLAETVKMAEQHKKLQKHVTESTSEITELRQKVQTMRMEVLTDPLTGIANRKCFDLRISEGIADAKENGQTVSLMMLDIDHFKKFNDTYGHQLGDEVLKLVARTFVESIKGQDTAARYGGEEFAIILPRTSLKNAMIVAEQIRKTMADKVIVNRRSGDKLGAVTLSIGVASSKGDELPSAILQRADEALYVAKRKGRNMVVPEGEIDALVAAAG